MGFSFSKTPWKTWNKWLFDSVFKILPFPKQVKMSVSIVYIDENEGGCRNKRDVATTPPSPESDVDVGMMSVMGLILGIEKEMEK